jgi:hypothetical protein
MIGEQGSQPALLLQGKIDDVMILKFRKGPPDLEKPKFRRLSPLVALQSYLVAAYSGI